MPESKRNTAALPQVFELNGRDGVPEARVAGFKARNLIRMAAMGLASPARFRSGNRLVQRRAEERQGEYAASGCAAIRYP